MTVAARKDQTPNRRVMLARPGSSWDRQWLADVDAAFGSAGLVACRAYGGDETAQCVQSGGLAAAVFWTERQWGEGLTLIRIVRSISSDLPCWLVGDDASRWALQEAFALRVTSVLARCVEPGELTSMLQRRLDRAAENLGN